jgi:hypothetical protein
LATTAREGDKSYRNKAVETCLALFELVGFLFSVRLTTRNEDREDSAHWVAWIGHGFIGVGRGDQGTISLQNQRLRISSARFCILSVVIKSGSTPARLTEARADSNRTTDGIAR